MLIIVTPMVLLQATVSYLLFDRQWESVTARMARGVSAQISLIMTTYNKVGVEQFTKELPELSDATFGMRSSLLPRTRIPDTESPAYEVLQQIFVRELSSRIGRPVWVDAYSLPDDVDIRVQTDTGVVRFVVERKRVVSTNTHIWVLWMAGGAIILLAVAIIFLRNQIRPIERLADAAEAFGKGRDVPDFRPTGATEVRRAALAFLDMRERISRFVQQRTDMLAGVSHDLRTPLTRIKLELAMMGDSPEAQALKGDIAEMEHMLDEYLAFARGQGGEPASDTDIGQLLREIAANAGRKSEAQSVEKAVDVKLMGDLVMQVRPNAMRRCLTNLVDNALRYGNRAELTAAEKGDAVEIAVDDDGPGIPADKREEVFRPFYRLEGGRNLASGNVGLGLAIARDIARGHGGDVTLSDSRFGGLRAVVRLPV